MPNNLLHTALNILAAIMLTVPVSACAASCSEKGPGEEEPGPGPIAEPTAYELSYWIDMDVKGKVIRGFWYDVSDYPAEPAPVEAHIKNACKKLRNDYGATKLYVIYHRQFEIDDAKTAFEIWDRECRQNSMEMVPTVVLQSYSSKQTMNFSNEEICAFADWCIKSVNNEEVGIYDHATRDRDGQPQAEQISLMKGVVGNKLVIVGQQPGVSINRDYKYAVQDTWSAECQGRTNELWENPVYFNGTNVYGRKLLEAWVAERRDNESRKVVWDLIPVAWNYDTDDPLSYTFPGDHQLYNDPPVEGRLILCKDYINSCYEGGVDNEKHGGFSCDLHILEANSGGRGETPSFYASLRESNVSYTGDFAKAIAEIGGIYKSLWPQK